MNGLNLCLSFSIRDDSPRGYSAKFSQWLKPNPNDWFVPSCLFHCRVDSLTPLTKMLHSFPPHSSVSFFTIPVAHRPFTQFCWRNPFRSFHSFCWVCFILFALRCACTPRIHITNAKGLPLQDHCGCVWIDFTFIGESSSSVNYHHALSQYINHNAILLPISLVPYRMHYVTGNLVQTNHTAKVKLTQTIRPKASNIFATNHLLSLTVNPSVCNFRQDNN